MRTAVGARWATVRDRFEALRDAPRRRAAVLFLGVAIGLAVATVHWIGFVVAGLAIGLTATSLGRSLGLAAIVGAAAGVAMLGYAAVYGQLDAVIALGEFAAIAVAMGIALVGLGALVRGVL